MMCQYCPQHNLTTSDRLTTLFLYQDLFSLLGLMARECMLSSVAEMRSDCGPDDFIDPNLSEFSRVLKLVVQGHYLTDVDSCSVPRV